MILIHHFLSHSLSLKFIHCFSRVNLCCMHLISLNLIVYNNAWAISTYQNLRRQPRVELSSVLFQLFRPKNIRSLQMLHLILWILRSVVYLHLLQATRSITEHSFPPIIFQAYVLTCFLSCLHYTLSNEVIQLMVGPISIILHNTLLLATAESAYSRQLALPAIGHGSWVDKVILGLPIIDCSIWKLSLSFIPIWILW